MKNRIIELLESTQRSGMDELICHMDENGFFEAPCSTRYHLSKQGGLAEHSLNVYELMLRLKNLLYPEISDDSVVICSLLHDIGKMGQYGKPNYIPKMLKGRATKANPNPEPYQSTAEPYQSNPDLMYVDHEVRSIQTASQFIALTEDENWAILMHNGMYGTFKYQIQGKETPLYLLLHMADMWASRVIEKEAKDE